MTEVDPRSEVGQQPRSVSGALRDGTTSAARLAAHPSEQQQRVPIVSDESDPVQDGTDGKRTPEVISPIREIVHRTPNNPADRRKSRRRDRDLQRTWASGPPEIMKSCSVALRRMGDAELSSLAVTSTARREGRTTIAIGLTAAAVLEHGRNAVLVDLDVERGSVEARMSLPPGPSLLEVIEGAATLDECLVPVDQRVKILRAGPQRDAISLVAQQDRLENLLQELSSRCDIVVADLPPLSAGITTAHLADLFQGVALVVRAGVTPVPQIDQVASTLTQRPFVMLNRTKARRRSPLRLLRLRS
jgi:Mrp family chromosome partitioning ATPase